MEISEAGDTSRTDGEERWVFEGEEGGSLDFAQGPDDPAEEANNDDYQPLFEGDSTVGEESGEDDKQGDAVKDFWKLALATGKKAYDDAKSKGTEEVLFEIDPVGDAAAACSSCVSKMKGTPLMAAIASAAMVRSLGASIEQATQMAGLGALTSVMAAGSRESKVDPKDLKGFYEHKPPTPPLLEEEHELMDKKDKSPKEQYIRHVADDKIVVASKVKSKVEGIIFEALERHLSLEQIWEVEAGNKWVGEVRLQEIQITRQALGDAAQGHVQITAQGGDLDMRGFGGSISPSSMLRVNRALAEQAIVQQDFRKKKVVSKKALRKKQKKILQRMPKSMYTNMLKEAGKSPRLGSFKHIDKPLVAKAAVMSVAEDADAHPQDGVDLVDGNAPVQNSDRTSNIVANFPKPGDYSRPYFKKHVSEHGDPEVYGSVDPAWHSVPSQSVSVCQSARDSYEHEDDLGLATYVTPRYLRLPAILKAMPTVYTTMPLPPGSAPTVGTKRRAVKKEKATFAAFGQEWTEEASSVSKAKSKNNNDDEKDGEVRLPAVVKRLYSDAIEKRQKQAKVEIETYNSMVKEANKFAGKKADPERTNRLYEDARNKHERRDELQRQVEKNMVQTSSMAANPAGKKSNPARSRQLYEDAGLKRQRMARLQLAHHMATDRAAGYAPQPPAAQQEQRDAMKEDINPTNRSEIERLEKEEKRRLKEKARQEKLLANRRAREEKKRMAEQKAKQEAEAAEWQRKQSEKIAAAERKRKAEVAAAEAAKKEAEHAKIQQMKKEIANLTNEPIASNSKVAPPVLDTTTSDYANKVAKKAGEVKKTMENYEKKKAAEAAKKKKAAEEDDDFDDYEDDYGEDDFDASASHVSAKSPKSPKSPKSLKSPKKSPKAQKPVPKSPRAEDSDDGYGSGFDSDDGYGDDDFE